LEQLIARAPEIIEKAAQSPLGIFALMILVVGVLAVLFFQRAPVQVRVVIFSLIFGGVVAFGFAIAREIPQVDNHRSTPTPEPSPDLSGDWKGEGTTDVTEVKRHFQDVYFPPGNMTFRFVADRNALRGTLFLRKDSRFYTSSDYEYGLLDGKIEGNRISFTIRSEFAVNDTPKVAIERFFGSVDGDQIRFTVQEDTGYPPLQFTAVRRSRDLAQPGATDQRRQPPRAVDEAKGRAGQ
jgi:hypothetical protein